MNFNLGTPSNRSAPFERLIFAGFLPNLPDPAAAVESHPQYEPGTKHVSEFRANENLVEKRLGTEFEARINKLEYDGFNRKQRSIVRSGGAVESGTGGLKFSIDPNTLSH